ncbi:MAG: SIS domain-containing protein [Anaerolineae bacterium]|nr:SIS domain-containing protein [Anaerolineae bacterium]
MQQPEVLRRVVTQNWQRARECAAAIASSGIRFALIAARGTSDHAATYAKYLWGSANRLPVALAAPSLYTFYQSPPRLDGALVVGISQSGASTDIVTVLEDARSQGALTLAVTNDEDSPLARACQFVLPCLAGEEKAVAATKTYTSQLACVALLSTALSGDKARQADIERIPDAVAQALDLEDQVRASAERYRYMESALVLSRGYNLATAAEIALKIKELTYSHVQAYSTADFMHGPLATVDEGFPVIAVASTGALYHNLLSSIKTVKDRQAEVVVISDADEALALGRVALRVPSVPEWLSPIVNIVPGQWLAHHLALTKGFDPDSPRALTKVTLTI